MARILGPEDLNPTDLDGLMALYAETTQGTWAVMPAVHEHIRIGLEGRGPFSLIATVETSTPDYGRANTAWIAAAHRLLPALAAELAEARKQLAARDETAAN